MRLIMQNPDLLLASYDFELPSELIAARPLSVRDESKLLVYRVQEDKIEHRHFYELPKLLPAESTLVFNQSKVFRARLWGQKISGGKCEIFLLSLMHNNGHYPVMIKSRGAKKIGDKFLVDNVAITITSILSDGTFLAQFALPMEEMERFLNDFGKLPIPPYIRQGVADEKDEKDYQTVYANQMGSVAAPTAGLHFTSSLLEKLKSQKIGTAFVTLHVGAGTFKPIVTDSILEHKMHAESFNVDQENQEKIKKARGHLVAVGTTSLRVLESCYKNRDFVFPDPTEFMATDIFLYPGKPVDSICALLTNFHLPKSSLLLLVSSVIGRQKTLELYQEAVAKKYRFFSYGDAMLILR